jgi:monoterpene epsilon-lactone hydrolase
MTATEDANKALVIEAFDTLFNRRDYSAAKGFWSPGYIQHSAHIAPGRDGLFDLVKALPAELRYEHELVVADGNHVMLHGRFSGRGEPVNWVVVDIVRIADGQLAEQWDIIQDEVDQTQSRSGLPMFGDTFTTTAAPDVDPPAPASLLLQAFIDYLRARPTNVDTATTRDFNDGAQLEGIVSRPSSLGGVPGVTLEPAVGAPERTVVYFHGGGYVSGSPPDRYLPLAAAVALAAHARVRVVDYRLAPEHRFPAAFEDCLAAYRWTVRNDGTDPENLAVLGDSAGGNLAVAVTAAARDEELPLPSCVAVISPFADLTFSGASLELRKSADPYVTRELLESMATEYLGGADPADPRCSSVFADLHGLPPLLIQVGEDEILFDDAARIRDAAMAAGVDTAFAPWAHGIHVWPVYISAGLPESAHAIEELAAFLRLHS